jgi:predicted nucleic acid-binding protein
VQISESDAFRVRRLCMKLGSVEKAREALGIGEVTMDAARGRGSMQEATRDRIIAALAKAEGLT